MKAVLISIRPKWCELIASGEKTVEVRKTKPKIETPFKVYIYMTMDKCPQFVYDEKLEKQSVFERAQNLANGRVIGEFVCDQVDEIGYSPEMHGKYISDIDDIHYVSCVNFEQMFDYLADGYGYGWHISNLVIYDEPKGLSEFLIDCKNCGKKFVGDPNCWQGCVNGYRRLTRPPQSWCYVEEQK